MYVYTVYSGWFQDRDLSVDCGGLKARGFRRFALVQTADDRHYFYQGLRLCTYT